jgi:hypothetical protein
MATYQTAWKKSDGPVRYFQNDREIHLGDRIELRGLLRKRRGSVNYVPGISDPHPELEHNALFWVGVALDNGTYTGAIVDPDTGCTRQQVRFLERGPTDAIASVPEAPWE